MKPDNDSIDLALETAEGLIRIYGSNALIQSDLIVARMKKHKDEKGAILWSEVADVVRKMQP
jgi:hypothetical protein